MKSESEELRKQLEAARSERQQTADSLASSQQAVTRLTDTLQGVTEARDRLEEEGSAYKVRPYPNQAPGKPHAWPPGSQTCCRASAMHNMAG